MRMCVCVRVRRRSFNAQILHWSQLKRTWGREGYAGKSGGGEGGTEIAASLGASPSTVICGQIEEAEDKQREADDGSGWFPLLWPPVAQHGTPALGPVSWGPTTVK